MNRRRFLHVLGIAGVTGASGATVALAASQHPTRADLERYYALLWAEHHALAEEMGVDMFDSLIIHRNGHYKAVTAAVRGEAPSTRALAVLTAAGIGRAS